MRIHQVTLRNYRGITERRVAFPANGVTIVEGDNETGKSSLPEALRLLFELPDSSTHRSVKAVQPVGRDVGAEVEAEITSGPYRFTYRKRWHRSKETTLDVAEPRREQLTGKAAHDRANAILDETLDRDLWQVLWLTQAGEVAAPAFAVPSLGRALDEVVGEEQAGDAEDTLWERICAERARYWTKHGRPSSQRTNLAADVEAARARIGELEAELATLDRAVSESEQCGRDLVTLRAQLLEREEAAESLARDVAAITARRSEVRRRAARREAASSDRARLAAAWERRLELIDDLGRRTNDLQKRRAELEMAAPERLGVSQRSERAHAALTAARKQVDAAEVAHRTAQREAQHLRDQLDLAQLVERRDRIEEAQARLDAADQLLSTIRIDDQAVHRIEEAHLAVARAEAAATSASPSLSAEALADVALLVDGQEVQLAAGTVEALGVDGSLELTVPGVVRLVIRPGADAQALVDRLGEARAELQRLCEDHGVVDLTDARSQAARRGIAERTRHEADEAIRRDLRDLTLDSIRQRIDLLTATITAHEATRSEADEAPTDLDAAEEAATALAHELADRREALRRLQDAADLAAAALRQVEVDTATQTALAEQAVVAVDQAARSLEEARAEVTDDALRAQLRSADDELTAATEALAEAEAELASTDPDTTELLLENARSTVEQLRARVHETEDRRRRLSATLEVKGELGLASDLDQERSRLEHLVREHEQLERRARAAQLLHDTFATRRTEATQRHLSPFRERIEQLGRIVFGPTFEVELDDQLRIVRRTLAGTTLDVEQLSVGAREQLAIIGRLACAAITSPDGGAPVVFDDALGWTDPGRLQLVGAAISVAARDCQVIVLTCTPGRYAGVGGATLVRLDGP